MTTIIADVKNGVMASDSRCTYEGVGAFDTDKLYRFGASIFGEAGDANGTLKFRRWVLDGMPKKRPLLDEENEERDFVVLELAPDGLFLWDGAFVRQAVKQGIYAIGSGRKVAMYCALILEMDVGKAVEEAAKIDIYTGGPVLIERLNEQKSVA